MNYTKEQELLQRLSNNDRAAIELLYKDNFSLIQKLVVNNNGSDDDAKDIFQEALVVLYEKAKSGHFELNCQVKTYLYSVSKRLWLKKLQRDSRYELQENVLEETVYVEEDLSEHQKRNAELMVMNNAMNSIGEPCKSLLKAFYVEKRNMQEIAADFGYTNADNAKNQKYKCLMRLKKIFFSQYKNGNPDE
ncbi:MAG: sigma-70 family RNA polymerase sigma factor [Chitinophagaceae bacterium]|nr:sigma-70 family RNA polymerase sigma factor [Chitinophagaceae bacterium]MCW5927444.1 sigma-70 family RNA polymerase sigma factor [Chitinophagaceae bacterium]